MSRPNERPYINHIDIDTRQGQLEVNTEDVIMRNSIARMPKKEETLDNLDE